MPEYLSADSIDIDRSSSGHAAKWLNMLDAVDAGPPGRHMQETTEMHSIELVMRQLCLVCSIVLVTGGHYGPPSKIDPKIFPTLWGQSCEPTRSFLK